MKPIATGAALLLVALTAGGASASGQSLELVEAPSSATVWIPVLRGIGGGFEGRSVSASGEVVETRAASMSLEGLIVTAESIRPDIQSRRVEAVGNVAITLRPGSAEVRIRAERITIAEKITVEESP